MPLGDVRTTLEEGSLALQGLPNSLGRVLENSDGLSKSALRNSDDLISLIQSAQTVLDTQVQLGGRTRQYAANLAGLTTELRTLDPTFDAVFVRGVAAGQSVTGLLQDNQSALPVLLNNLVSLTTLGDRHLAGIKKSLVVFPWTLDNAQGLRVLRQGRPTYRRRRQGHLSLRRPGPADLERPRGRRLQGTRRGAGHTCTRGYESTKRYLANGRPADGSGPKQPEDAQPNFEAHCAAPPTDPNTPNVRGFQNLGSGSSGNRVAPAWGLALMNPDSGVVVTPNGLPLQLTSRVSPLPDDGSADLGWLMTQNLTD